MNWDNYFLDMVDLVASKSESRSKKVGAVVVGPDHEVRSTGYNGLPRGIEDLDDRHIKPDRYMWMEHAERNAIYNAARCGISLKGCTLYLSYYPCADCARGIIQVGITTIVIRQDSAAKDTWKSWANSIRVATEMLVETGIKVRIV